MNATKPRHPQIMNFAQMAQKASERNPTSGSASTNVDSTWETADTGEESSITNVPILDTGDPFMWDEQHTISKYSNFKGSGESIDALKAIREVLEIISQNDIEGPQLFRLNSEFSLELGKGTQFRVTGASKEFRSKVKRARKLDNVEPSQEEAFLWETLDTLADSVVKRALWTPDLTNRRFLSEAHGEQLSQQDMARELESQLRSAKKEIDKLCNKAYRKHPNIIRLWGWGLCLDTFEAHTTLNTRIPLLVMEKATCDLADFLASSNYTRTSFESLIKICSDIGTGLGALHAGNVTHGDMKPENILLFANGSLIELEVAWTAKLCDFGNAESKSWQISTNIDSLDASRMYSSNSEVSEHFVYAGTPGWIPPEAYPEKGPFKTFDFENLKRCDVFVYGLVLWRIFQDDNERGEYDNRTKKRKSNRRHLVDGEKINQYLPPYDLAYEDAAKSIKKASHAGRIPAEDMWRILQVIRVVLQPIPQHRDSRPWKFFDTVYYSIIRSFNENPIRDEVASETYKRLYRNARHNLDIVSALSLRASRRLQETRNFLFSDLPGPFLSIYSYMMLKLPSTIEKPPRQKAFENLYAIASSKLSLSWNLGDISKLNHAEESCYSFSELCSTIQLLSAKSDIVYDSEDAHKLYAHARLRSRFKNCCWQSWTKSSGDFNTVALFLFPTESTGLNYSLENHHSRLLVHHCSNYLSTLAWLCRGEVGERELRNIADSEKLSSRLWSWTYRKGVPLEFRQNIFHLFVERGCYVGPGFRQFLESLVEESASIHTNYSYIVSACAKVMQCSKLCLTSKPNQNPINTATRRFFLRGESPDQTEDEINNYNTSTVLHEAVIACCYPAVEYFVQCSAIPLMLRDNAGKTPLELAVEARKSHLETWQLVHIDAIVGILSKTSKFNGPISELPLGWESLQLEDGVDIFFESTVNPKVPSLTFQAPRFSLLQEARIPLGSRKSDHGGLTYNFDLVRFMHRPILDRLKDASIVFGDNWYESECPGLHASVGASMKKLWIRVIIQVFNDARFVLFRSYLNILLIFLPITMFLSREKQQNITLLAISLLATIPVIGGLEAALKDLHPVFPYCIDQTLISRTGSCAAEVFIGIIMIDRGDIELIEYFLVGTVICNQLLIPGICFFAGGIHNIRTGTRMGIEQRYSDISHGLASTLVAIASVFSMILFFFAEMQDTSSPQVEASTKFLSRAIAIISLVLFVIWLIFRHYTHIHLFNEDFLDGYDDEESRPNVEITRSANAILATIFIILLAIQSRTIVASLQTLDPKSKRDLALVCMPLLLRVSKHVEAFKSAVRDDMDHTLDLTLGFTVTISHFVGPFLVVLSWSMGKTLTLIYNLYCITVCALSSLTIKYIVSDGKSNWLNGVLMVVTYTLIIACGLLT
ncbi:hypothetical protein BOTCAL_0462g00050 [Botryotinia calthae]|uniref:Protein kinase domain-containing protein n=1 Tax=Botryotinia calthae TaxID=38488 RepID=A0A4Y8CMM7_9HELO|nr:hypothetical protein BOTCAL_0462g00050 [Botryotinia calthae]